MANGRQPASIHVAMMHALRLDELDFPNPASWCELAERINMSSELLPYPGQPAHRNLLDAIAVING
jgi:hypothetical protein